MGAAGLTCTTCEPTSKSGTGVDIEVSLVPCRETDMTPYEIMLSESQERMLLYVQAGQEERVAQVYRKWDLNAVKIGHVTDDGIVRVRLKGEVVAEIPATFLTHECPTYELQAEEPDYLREKGTLKVESLPMPDDWNETLLTMLRSPNIASKRWVFEQYDWLVQTQTVLPPGEGDAAVLRIRGTQKGIALKIDGNGRYCYLDPLKGGQIAVAEAARNVACTGAMPRAITDCLNFGNPQKPHVFFQFQKCVEGIAQASEYFDTPVISGNVSFYNESELGEVLPTPTIGMLGVLDRVEDRVGAGFPQAGLKVLLISDGRLTEKDEAMEHGLGASEYLSVVHGQERGAPASLSLKAERALQRFLVEAARRRLIASAHDLSDGGFAVALAECAIIGQIGANVELMPEAFAWTNRIDAELFGERHTRVLVSAEPDKTDTLQALAESHGLACLPIGTTGGDRLTIGRHGEILVDASLSACAEAYESLKV